MLSSIFILSFITPLVSCIDRNETIECFACMVIIDPNTGKPFPGFENVKNLILYRMGWVNYTCEKSGPLFWPAFLCHSFYFRLRNSELKRERQRDFRLVRFPPYDSDYICYNPCDWLKFSTENVRWPFWLFVPWPDNQIFYLKFMFNTFFLKLSTCDGRKLGMVHTVRFKDNDCQSIFHF